MRFLNINLSIPEKKIDKSIQLNSGLNVIHSDSEFMESIIPELPLIALYNRCFGASSPADILESETFTVNIEAENSGEKISFINKNSRLKNANLNKPGFISFDDLILHSFFIPGNIEKGTDPALSGSKLKKFLINREPDNETSGNLHRLDDVTASKEKEINELKKSRELLELKKRKKDKLLKELSTSERELGRLRRRRESYTIYKNTLTELADLMQEETKLSSKIVNLKKDIIEIRETDEKRGIIEKEIEKRFPQFTKGMIDKLPDLERLQDEFNTIRDINEEIEKFNSGKKRKKSQAGKRIAGCLLFAFISIIFILFNSISPGTMTGMILGAISSLLLLISAATAYDLFILTKRGCPEDLLERKKTIESGLLEIFNKESIPEKNFGTGELYEYLLQYFEEFLSFRELQNELNSISKGTGSRSALEEKLKNSTERKLKIEGEIDAKLKSLDENIHPAPDREGIKNLLPEIDEMIAEIAKEEQHKDSMAKKIENETKQYETGEKSEKNIDESIEVINADIEKLKNEIHNISFMQKVYDETSDEWFTEKLSVLSKKCSEIYTGIIKSKKSTELQDSIKELVISGKSGNFTPEETAVISLSMKLALGEMSPPEEFCPFITVAPFKYFKPEIAEKLKKILLELSEKRQVVIITSKIENNLAGNLINI